MRKAIYALSGDPITFGHIDIIERAAKIFDEVIAAIGDNPVKQYMFSTDERVGMAKQALNRFANVSVMSFKGLLADFAYENDIRIILRGLRNSEDFNFELLLHQLGETQVDGMETFLMPCRQALAHVSSSAAKALQLEQGLISEYVPLNVKQKLEERISGQLLIGVTGEIASGKTSVTEKILEFAERAGMRACAIDLDILAHEILEKSTEPVYQNFRKCLAEKFGRTVCANGGFITSKKLGEIIFSDLKALTEFNQLIFPILVLRLRKEIYHKRGLILILSSLLAESGLLSYCNNHLIVTACSGEDQLKHLKARGYSEEKIRNLLNAQFPFGKKVSVIESQIEKNNFGKLFIANNGAENVGEIFRYISELIPAFAPAHA